MDCFRFRPALAGFAVLALGWTVPGASAQSADLEQLLRKEYSARAAQLTEARETVAKAQSDYDTLAAALGVLPDTSPVRAMMQKEIAGFEATLNRQQQAAQVFETDLRALQAALEIMGVQFQSQGLAQGTGDGQAAVSGPQPSPAARAPVVQQALDRITGGDN